MTKNRIFLDTCVLVPITLTDLLLHMMEADLWEGCWSNLVLEELKSALQKIYKDSDSSALGNRVKAMQESFPSALVTESFSLPPSQLIYLPDLNDSHVIQSAIAAGADTILTFNKKDFPEKILDLYNLRVAHPDDFLLEFLKMNSSLVLDVVQQSIQKQNRPRIEVPDYLSQIGKLVPNFATAISSIYASTRSAK